MVAWMWATCSGWWDGLPRLMSLARIAPCWKVRWVSCAG
jgi:hypothetical protein